MNEHLFIEAYGEGWETFWRHYYGFEQNIANCPTEVLELCEHIIAED